MSAATTIVTSDIEVLTEVEARYLTTRIKQTADALWMLLYEAYTRRAWEPLGYANFREYAKNEFEFSQSYLYRLVDQGKVIRALEAAANISPMGEIVSERDAREIKPHLDLVLADVHERVDRGDDPVVAVRSAVEGARERYSASHKPVDRSNRYIEASVRQVRAIDDIDFSDPEARIAFADLDPMCFDAWLADLRRGAKAVQRLIRPRAPACSPESLDGAVAIRIRS
jgi:hypothetical protein